MFTKQDQLLISKVKGHRLYRIYASKNPVRTLCCIMTSIKTLLLEQKTNIEGGAWGVGGHV